MKPRLVAQEEFFRKMFEVAVHNLKNILKAHVRKKT